MLTVLTAMAYRWLTVTPGLRVCQQSWSCERKLYITDPVNLDNTCTEISTKSITHITLYRPRMCLMNLRPPESVSYRKRMIPSWIASTNGTLHGISMF